MARRRVLFVVTKDLAFITRCSAVKAARCARQDLFSLPFLTCVACILSCLDHSTVVDQMSLYNCPAVICII